MFSYLRAKYDDLPEKGKFATGAAVGFGGSRVAIKSAVSVVKVAGAAFIAYVCLSLSIRLSLYSGTFLTPQHCVTTFSTEVLNAAGVLDDIPSLSEEQSAMAENVKRRALSAASGFRTTLRKRLNPENLKSLMETDRMATMGAAAGAFVGFLL